MNHETHLRLASARMAAADYEPLHRDIEGGFTLGLFLVWGMFAFFPLSVGWVVLTFLATAGFLALFAGMMTLAGRERRSWGDPASLSYGDSLIRGSGKMITLAAVALTIAALAA
ncbi:hypothetical protein MARCHEWKA_02140 [Brevundimonas phage vB_BpoS-Marchewka]|uniref:Uncharacterized protein n=1 Tax=Brevundimonas phage vB_BpoS-Marchewka TaxID=2948604 RepID=A0A9E7N5T2_9CAUD|nr:hypothetical protein MARCHEWKA_02140 [Brevundimonas phage vB_BpoS-Marchewka]